MKGNVLRNEELLGAKERKASETEVRKAVARRAYEAGEMTIAEISRLACADPRTIERWRKEGQWKRSI